MEAPAGLLEIARKAHEENRDDLEVATDAAQQAPGVRTIPVRKSQPALREIVRSAVAACPSDLNAATIHAIKAWLGPVEPDASVPEGAAVWLDLLVFGAMKAELCREIAAQARQTAAQAAAAAAI